MKKYQLLNDLKEPLNIFVDEDCVEEFLDLSGWTKEEFKEHTKEVDYDKIVFTSIVPNHNLVGVPTQKYHLEG